MSRLYFDCPIQAFYMMREFGVLFENKSQIIDGVNNMWQFGKKEISANYYVAKESEYIFEIRANDQLFYRDENIVGVTFIAFNGEMRIDFNGDSCEIREKAQIIMRNNKPFFTALVENVDN